MFQHIWTILAKKSHIDQDTNNLIIGEVVEEIQITLPKEAKAAFEAEIEKNKMSHLPMEFEVLSYFVVDELKEKSEVSIELELPNGHTFEMIRYTLNEAKNGRMRGRIRCPKLPFSRAGVNHFKLYDVSNKNKKLLTDIPLYIKLSFEDRT
jgi:hypothetical protein